MRAAQFSRFGGPEVLEIVDLPDPEPGPDEVRIRVRAAGIGVSDFAKRAGLMDPELPQTLGYEAAGLVDRVGADVRDLALGERVLGLSPYGAAQAELAVLALWALAPDTLDDAQCAALPAAAETAARSLDLLGVEAGESLLVNGASGSIGSAAVQLAVERGARVIGVGGPASHDRLRRIGADPVAYGDGLTERVRALLPDGVDRALDIAGNAILPELIALTGSPERVVTVADVAGAERTGVRFSRGDAGRATYAVAQAAALAAAGRYDVEVARTFPLADIAEAHRLAESGAARGKLVLLVD